MSENQKHHTDPDPLRPSQAEGEAEDTDDSSAETPIEGVQGENRQADPLRPSKAEGGSEQGAASKHDSGGS
ncbi:MAG: hypothetical protein ACTHWF_12940 [Brachybacterium sp.]|uniref:hypothetical protein n=1 Tax=Brachybacterium sp. Z12 TaxID=2759167 RepID=UPI001861C60A|nr:hypothetical protein [Brachybacterium sp. Z12]QNN82287.1 hypothetical protein H3H54_14625 [Brachybacterium sp. Z12]